jgi:hypothetical protein
MADGPAEIEGGIVRTLKDLFAGAAGGVAQVLIGMGIFLPLLGAGGISVFFGHVPWPTSLVCCPWNPWASFRIFKGMISKSGCSAIMERSRAVLRQEYSCTK